MELVYQDKSLALIEECKKGNQDAFYKLYKSYAKQMLSTSLRIVKNKSEAEDIVQDSFISAFNKIADFEFKSTFGAWIKRIVINNSLNFIKKKRIEFDELSEKEERLIEEESEIEYPVLSVDKIQETVKLLPDGFRIVLSLYLFEEYSHKEIAEELNISVSTSKSQYNRAKKRLKELLIENYGIQER